MQFLLIPVAGYLFLYAPGHYLLRARASHQPGSSPRLLQEVLLSVGCTSWLGFVLAEMGWYSLTALAAAVGIVSLLGRLVRDRGAAERYGWPDAAGVVLLALTWLWIAPPLDTRILGADSAGYLASGVHLARHGSLVIHDPTMDALSPDLKRILFPSVAPDRGSPPYLRLAGSMVLRNLDSDEVLPAFHHLIAVWVATCYGLAGPPAAQWAITLFGGLSVWAIAACASELIGAPGGVAVGLLLLILSPQYWYSRFLMPEVPAQFFLWSGLYCLACSERAGTRTDMVLAGIAFGLAGMMRTENAVFLGLGIVGVVLTTAEGRRTWMVVLLAAGALWSHAIVHLIIFRTHYLGILGVLLWEHLPSRPMGQLALVSLATALAAILILARRRLVTARSGSAFLGATAAGLVGVAVAGSAHSDWESLRLLLFYTGVPTTILGGLGVAVALNRCPSHPRTVGLLVMLAALAFLQFAVEPHATPVPIWTIRRAVTILLPALIVGVAVLVKAVGDDTHKAALIGLLCVAGAGQLQSLRQLRQRALYEGPLRHIEALATMIPRDACVLVDSHLVGMGVAETLWSQYDLPTYFFTSSDSARLNQLLRSLGRRPIVWINDASSALPATQFSASPVARYEFVISTPSLDISSAPKPGADRITSIGLYRLRDFRR